ncbi:protein kinase [Streptomyces sp. NPDC058655]|uniref:serine/threonine-protein kinase n=1 Tax=Streptomyces sp. NPDC058655 TaxID=3346577 RepID=UPI0036699117
MPARTVPAYGAQFDGDALLAGRYRLHSPIGSGGTADVFRGTDEVLGREVAVKVFRPGTDTVTAETFCDEARTLARLSHRALVTVYDAGRHGQGAFMVTELICGVTLRARIDAGPLNSVQVTRLGVDLASALDHVHAHGIVHHDVKPSNVLLHHDGSPRLADFGLSRTVHDRSLSGSETLVGTLAYMAPEQFLGHGASPAGDVYALGLTLLEALTGHREYQGTPVEVGTAHLLHPPRVPAGLPDGLGRLLTAMTDPEPSARPDAARVHLLLQDVAHAPAASSGAGTTVTASTAGPTRSPTGRPERSGPDGPLPAPRNGARSDTSTHRSPLPSHAAARHAARRGQPPAPVARRAPTRRRAAVLGLTVASVAGACTLLLGGLPAGETAPPTPFRHQTPAQEKAEAAAPRPEPSSPPVPESPQPTAVASSTTAHPPPSTAPAGADIRQPVSAHPVARPPAAKSKDHPGKAKGRKGKGPSH